MSATIQEGEARRAFVLQDRLRRLRRRFGTDGMKPVGSERIEREYLEVLAARDAGAIDWPAVEPTGPEYIEYPMETPEAMATV